MQVRKVLLLIGPGMVRITPLDSCYRNIYISGCEAGRVMVSYAGDLGSRWSPVGKDSAKRRRYDSPIVARSQGGRQPK